jgi:diacylglycerol kinase (ATP)
LNTAIEKLSDRVNSAIDPQIGRVKDMGSAAVGLTLLVAGAAWLLALAERIGWL